MTDLKSEVRVKILSLYGINISGASVSFSDAHGSFVLSLEKHTILITPYRQYTHNKHVASILWADDVKQFKDTICEVVISNKRRVSEEIFVAGTKMTITVFKHDRGKVIDAKDVKPILLINAGDMLGTIHSVSEDQQELGIKYKIPTVFKLAENQLNYNGEMFDEKTLESIKKLIENIKGTGTNPSGYGVCFGEYTISNLIIDTNNIYIMNYDTCVYAPYMYDVASFVFSMVFSDYELDRSAYDIINKNLVPWFKIGYRISKDNQTDAFVNLEEFIRFRVAYMYLSCNSNPYKMEKEKENMEYYRDIIVSRDIYPAIDEYRRELLLKT